jgi:hypothetical protein
VDLVAHVLFPNSADDSPERVLVVRLSDDFQRLVAYVKGRADRLRPNIDGVGR